MARANASSLDDLNAAIVGCRRCPRLVAYRERVAGEKRAAYRSWDYWGRPLPGWGDPNARLLIVGLAPAAHGGNRTGRMFTGDRSGDWLYRALYRAGFASQVESISREDGLQLFDCYITAAVRCAPPANRPTREEFERCRPYLARELKILRNVRVVIVLGRMALDSFLRAARAAGHAVPSPRPQFRHAAVVPIPPWILVMSYHPSQRNTSTGKLTEVMFDEVFRRARAAVHEIAPGGSRRAPETRASSA